MLKYPVKLITHVILIIFCGFYARAESVFTNASGYQIIGKHIYVLQPAGEMSFDEVKKSLNFTKYAQDVPNLGFSKHSNWLKFTITNNSDNGKLLLDVAYPLLDEVELFSPDDAGVYHSKRMGGALPFKERIYDHPDYIFNLSIPKNATKTYYLRIKSEEQLILPISISTEVDLWEHLSKEATLTGIFMGVVVIIVLYNLFIFFSIRDRAYLYYVGYVIFVGLTQIGIKGISYQHFWPNSPGFELQSVVLFACIAPVFALLFTKTFLSTSIRAPKVDVLLSLAILSFVIAFGITVFGWIQLGFLIMQISTTVFAFSMIVASAIVLRRGYRPARFILVSWSMLLIGAIIFALKDNGILPYNTFTSYAMQGGTAIEMAILSFALADKINILKREKETSQAEALSIAKENERIIREQNALLEEKVTERTHELNESLNGLKQTQLQLVESEKMASLGQLTAGIAHEINNPINFVTANVKPLKRDLETLLEIINVVENIGLSNASSEEKQQKIAAYKAEQDFDYLLVEIGQLLNGINEGASRTAEIVKGLRIFSRLDEDDLKLADLNEGLESTMIIANNLFSNNVKVVKQYGTLPLVECYAGKLNQVFLNIIANAAYAINKKFGDQSGGELTLQTMLNDDIVEIKIIDNGVGMSEETKRKVFEPFFTTKDVGEGTGLGMSIAYNTIKRHNGKLQVESTPGEGTAFTVSIPVNFNNSASA